MTTVGHISFDEQQLHAICTKWHVVRVSIYGSVLRDDFNENSDVDVLVEFAPGKTPGYGFITLMNELSTLFGHEADLGTFTSIRSHAKNEILSTSKEIYVAA